MSSTTKFKPVNQHLILLRESEDATTVTGIIDPSKTTEKYTVIEANEGAEDILNKQVFLKEAPIKLQGETYCTSYDNVIAYAS